MIITISGVPGSGKSTVGRIIAKKLGCKFFSIGDIRGEIAICHGITIDELNKIGETEEWTDRETDEYQKDLGKKEKNLVVEGRLSFHFIPQSFKIFLYVEPTEAARRALKSRRNRTDEKLPKTIEEVEKTLLRRLKSDKKRYQKYYGVDYTVSTNFDLFLNTTKMPILKVVAVILDKIKGLR